MTATGESIADFSSWPLHDALLHDLRVDWRGRICTAEIEAFVNGLDHEAIPRRIVWQGVKEIFVPHHSPWGEAFQINSTRVEKPGLFVIEMQSGDEIRVTANTVEFVDPNT